MKDVKDFQERYNRWKNGERYWDIRGVDLPKYDTGKYITVRRDDGSVYNVNPNVANSSEITVTTPEIEVVAQKPFYLKKREQVLNNIIYNPGEIRQGEEPSVLDNVRTFLSNYRDNPIARNVEQTVEDWQHHKTPMQAAFDNFAYINPYTAAIAAGSNLLSDHGISRTVNLAKNGQYSRAALSGLVDILNLSLMNRATNGLKNISKLSQYKLRIPENKDSYYRIVNGMDAIDDANNSGMITRPYVGDYYFPYFTKGQLYNRQNKAFNFGNRTVVIQSKPEQQFEFVTDGIHSVHPEKLIKVGDSATPVIKNGIGTAYNSAPTENFTYWSRGNGLISKYFWKQHEFTPFKNNKIISRRSYGRPIAEGSESEVFENPSNKYTVLKEYSGGFRNNLNGMRDELIRRNSVPGAVPTKIEGITQDGYPVLSQPIVQAYPEGTKWTYNMAKDVINLLRRTGYTRGLHEGVPNNGMWKLVDLSPQNIGYLNGDVRLIDVPPYKL